MSKQTICVVCAYRENCQKKFRVQGGSHCTEFERDLSIKEPGPGPENKPAEEEKGK